MATGIIVSAKSEEYERLIGLFAGSIHDAAEDDGGEVKVGARNRWVGRSGYSHQIDVTVATPATLWMIECKHWGRAVSVDHVLTMAARTIDIREARVEEVRAAMVTTKAVQRGAEQVANHFGIELSVVTSPDEFAIRYKNLFRIGIAARGSSTTAATLKPLRAE